MLKLILIMNYITTTIIFLSLSAVCLTQSNKWDLEVTRNVTTADIKELRHELFVNRGYDRFARPIPKNDTLKISLNYNLIHISGLDVREQTLTVKGWLTMLWHDESLVWDGIPKYKHIQSIRVPSDQVYRPDIMAYNGIDYEAPTLLNTNVIVYNKGLVMWVPPVAHKVLCQVNLKRWPADEHVCFIKYGSWTHDGWIMDMIPLTEKTTDFLSNVWKNTEFDISFINVTREVKHYDCCVEPYPSITFYFKIQRKPMPYHLILSVPAVVAVILSLISFWFPIRSNIRFILNSVSFLTLTSLLLYMGSILGFSSLGIPIAVRYISLTTLLVGLLQIWSTIGYNISLLKCQIPKWTMRLTKPLLHMMYKHSEQEVIQVVQIESESPKKSSQPNAEDLTYIIDKIVFVFFLVSVLINAFA